MLSSMIHNFSSPSQKESLKCLKRKTKLYFPNSTILRICMITQKVLNQLQSQCCSASASDTAQFFSQIVQTGRQKLVDISQNTSEYFRTSYQSTMCVCVCSFMCTGCILGFTRLGNLGTLILSVILSLILSVILSVISQAVFQHFFGFGFGGHEYLGAVYSLIKAEYERQKTQFHGESVIKGSSPTSDLIFQDGQILKPVKGKLFVPYSKIFFVEPVVWDEDSECLIFLSRHIFSSTESIM